MSDARGVARIERATGASFAHIAAARARTEQGLAERRARLETVPTDDDVTVVLMGSWGRREVTAGSDDDFVIVSVGERREHVKPTPGEVAGALGGPAPGTENVFGGDHVSLADLRERIGRDEDSNTNLTRRMLLMLESVAVAGPEVHAQARRALLAGYLENHARDHRPPRFLLNDLIRYWRTIAVDFESKMRARRGEGWGLRLAKLGLSRKALFAGGLLPVLECYRFRTEAMLDHLDERMALPPLDRIADAFADHQDPDAGVRTLTAYDAFLGVLDDDDARGELSALSAGEADGSPLLARVEALADDFEAGLLSLLFDDPELRRWVRDYVIF